MTVKVQFGALEEKVIIDGVKTISDVLNNSGVAKNDGLLEDVKSKQVLVAKNGAITDINSVVGDLDELSVYRTHGTRG